MTTAGLLSLFIGSLLASSVLPGGVEVLLYALVESGAYSSTALLAVATVGNTLGGLTTYAVGVLLRRGLAHLSWGRQLQRRFQLTPAALARCGGGERRACCSRGCRWSATRCVWPRVI